MNRVDDLMEEGIREGVFPGGVVLVSNQDTVCFFKPYGHTDLSGKQPITGDTWFDLASLTKPLATTLAVIKLIQQSKLELNQKIETILNPLANTPKGSITTEHLLTHTSGLPDYRPYYKRLERVPVEQRRAVLRDFLVKEPLEASVGERTVYSDLGFMILSWIIETVSGMRLDRFVEERIYTPLDINELFFIDVLNPASTKSFAATESCAWRKQVAQGVVHDENAFAAGGIEGHAGLFGTAKDVHRLLALLLKIYQGRMETPVLDQNLVKHFLTKQQGFERAFGFDTPDEIDSSCGKYFSENTVGHLGFTGTSFWMDLKQSIIVILLTNRIHPKRTNEQIRAFRPRLHDTVMQSIYS